LGVLEELLDVLWREGDQKLATARGGKCPGIGKDTSDGRLTSVDDTRLGAEYTGGHGSSCVEVGVVEEKIASWAENVHDLDGVEQRL
jgi:hypothetical protein